MIGRARNRVLVSLDFGPRQLNGDATTTTTTTTMKIMVVIDLVVVSAGVDLTSVLLPPERRHRHPADLGLERHRLSLGHRLVAHTSEKARWTRRLASCSERSG